MVGLEIGQIGEFSFILSRAGVEYGLVDGDLYQMFIAVTILSMAATPFVIALAPRVSDVILRIQFPFLINSFC